MQSWIKRFGLVAAVLLLVGVGAFVAWAASAAAPMPEAMLALEDGPDVAVESGRWLAFRPASHAPTTGLILYPGGRVDPRSYAPAAREIASTGYWVIIVPMPLNLAVFGPDRATQVQSAYPQVTHWAVGGHSLGGAMAARYALRYPDVVQGLVLWAAYPASTDDLSGQHLAVTSIYGTEDGLATVDKIRTSEPLLPQATTWVGIEGGNHAQFGWYGPQSGDKPAALDRLAQQQAVVASTVALLHRLAE